MNTTINFLGTELDATKEHELFKNDGLGFNITVTYSEDSWRYERGIKTSTFNNCTELHWRFNQNDDFFDKESAFESDIHGTGCTRKIKEITSVVVVEATKVEENY